MASSDAMNASNKKPNILKKLWIKSGIQPPMLLVALKGALPATIALAAYESKVFAAEYTTIGYLIAIIAHLSLAMQPRAKFLQALFSSMLFACVGAAMSLLELQCVVAARSTPLGGTKTGSSGQSEANTYDASANTVAGVFLFVWVYIANFVMSARPALKLSTIQFTIFVVVASTYGPSFPTMPVAEAFVVKLLKAFFTGYGIAAGVSLLILPMTSRGNSVKQMGGLTKLFAGCISSHEAFMKSVTKSRTLDTGISDEEKAASKQLKDLLIKTGELLGKLKLEISFARKEIAFGKLHPHHFSEIFEMMREILSPVMGMSTFLTIMQTLREGRQAFEDNTETRETMTAMKQLARTEWDDVIAISEEAYSQYSRVLHLGLKHISYQLEFEKRPKQDTTKTTTDSGSEDTEKTAGEDPKPGSANFAMHLNEELQRWQHERTSVIRDWAAHRNLNLSKRFMNHDGPPRLERHQTTDMRRKLNQHQLYLILYMNFLSHALGLAILKLAKYADGLVEDGTMKKKRVIWPGVKRLRKLFVNAFAEGDGEESLGADVNGGGNIYLGDALKEKKDPEHMPPSNLYEKTTDYLRIVPKTLSSRHSSFAFRAAVAAMSLGVVAYLRQTRGFFLQQRGLWAMIMAAISMDVTAGQGIFGFLARIGGTAFAMVMSMVIWYMCDRKHAAILVLFYLYMACWMLFLVTRPQFAVVAMISSITVVLILGYEMQVDVIGIAVATSNGQEYYPVYLLGPYRLATVCIGLGAAFFWTYFPYPVTTHGALRDELGSTLYILANFYSVVHTTLDARLNIGHKMHELPADSPVQKLDAARQKVFAKVLLKLTNLRTKSSFIKFEPQVGGKFPAETYNELTTSVRNVFTYLSLMVYASHAFTTPPQGQTPEEQEEEEQWLRDFRRFASTSKMTSHAFTMNLCLLSASIRNSQPLPPYLQTPEPFLMGDKMEEADPELLGVQHFAHPCYAAFAVGEVARAFISAEMSKIKRLIKELVGEVDFSFHVISTKDDDASETSTLWDKDEHATKATARSGRSFKDE